MNPIRRAAISALIICALAIVCMNYQRSVTAQHLWRCAHVPAVETHCGAR